MRFTSEWLQQRQAKNEPAEVKPTKSQAKEKEIHEFILLWCKDRRWIAFHGSMAHATHRTPGEPDFTILADDGQFIMIECKVGNKKPSDDQRNIIHWAGLLGHKIHVVRSVKEAAIILNSFRK